MRLILTIVISCLFLSQAKAETSAVVWQAHCRDRHPVIYVEKGECKGPGAAVINQVITRLGHKVNWSNVPWARTIKVAETGQVDLIPVHSMTPERNDFLDPMLLGYDKRYVYYFALANRQLEVKHFDELKPHIIGALRGAFYCPQFNDNQNQLKVSFVNDNGQLINMLKAERIDLAITSEQHEMQFFAKDPQLKQMEYVDISKNGRYFSIPLKSPRHQYAKQVHQIVDDMRTSGEITRLFESYGVEPPLNLTESPLATH
ncbi:transporter substrate-binding domain-containing protein [Shewanella sp. SP2S2-4]|uniref:substrate-binding periplasmic protein n=1 Tax=unclassified Shewanella TaxID=196818 RepID=UPI00288DA9E3|nr:MULTISPECIES: transporter substrate-binding domain-containing protein [unclassified Shewanella]MDT3275789.1 transporter substrate-binding domain-containing protein [Shewanella sp. SP2S2-4]MDT3335316.1 transporter substrate-binding domain-containing protein [Shewanella sp. SP1S1-7]